MPEIALTADTAVRHSFPDIAVEIITPIFADDVVIFANSAVLLPCPVVIHEAGLSRQHHLQDHRRHRRHGDVGH